jgi:hypothetical protein
MTLTLTNPTETKMFNLISRKCLGFCAVVYLAAIGSASATTDDSVTLLITGASGAVLMVENMTQRECDAAVAILVPRVSGGNFIINGSSSGALFLGGGSGDAPKTPAVTSAKCLKATTKP